VRLLQALADATSVAMENVSVYAELEHRVRARTEDLTRAHLEIRQLAVTDELTGLLNRRGFYEAARLALARKVPILLVSIDADGLKGVNDTLGHAVGDTMLADIAETLRTCFRASDIIARMGGDEYCVMMIDPGIDEAALREILLRRIEEANAARPRAYHLAASFGCIAVPDAAPEDLDHWLIEVDRRMYVEKTARKERLRAV
jgi:diguanylate cyclase (GGDEF)-like protein